MSPLPLPVRYHICYGDPIVLDRADPDDPACVQAAATGVRVALEGLIRHGLAERKGVFL
jgi:hypothetical protein